MVFSIRHRVRSLYILITVFIFRSPFECPLQILLDIFDLSTDIPIFLQSVSLSHWTEVMPLSSWPMSSVKNLKCLHYLWECISVMMSHGPCRRGETIANTQTTPHTVCDIHYCLEPESMKILDVSVNMCLGKLFHCTFPKTE